MRGAMRASEIKYPTGLFGLLCLVFAVVAHDAGADRWFAYLLFASVASLGTAAGLYWMERDMDRQAAARRFGAQGGGQRRG